MRSYLNARDALSASHLDIVRAADDGSPGVGDISLTTSYKRHTRAWATGAFTLPINSAIVVSHRWARGLVGSWARGIRVTQTLDGCALRL